MEWATVATPRTPDTPKPHIQRAPDQQLIALGMERLRPRAVPRPTCILGGRLALWALAAGRQQRAGILHHVEDLPEVTLAVLRQPLSEIPPVTIRPVMDMAACTNVYFFPKNRPFFSRCSIPHRAIKSTLKVERFCFFSKNKTFSSRKNTTHSFSTHYEISRLDSTEKLVAEVWPTD